MNATISVKSALQAGASMVLLPTFDARLFAQAIAKYRVTSLTSVPTMPAFGRGESSGGGNPDKEKGAAEIGHERDC